MRHTTHSSVACDASQALACAFSVGLACLLVPDLAKEETHLSSSPSGLECLAESTTCPGKSSHTPAQHASSPAKRFQWFCNLSTAIGLFKKSIRHNDVPWSCLHWLKLSGIKPSGCTGIVWHTEATFIRVIAQIICYLKRGLTSFAATGRHSSHFTSLSYTSISVCTCTDRRLVTLNGQVKVNRQGLLSTSADLQQA